MLTYSVGWAIGRGCAGRDSTLPTGECWLRVRLAACRFPSTLSHSRGVERRTSTSGLLAQVLVGLTPGSERGEQGIERLRSAEGITLTVGHAERHQAFAYLLGFGELGITQGLSGNVDRKRDVPLCEQRRVGVQLLHRLIEHPAIEFGKQLVAGGGREKHVGGERGAVRTIHAQEQFVGGGPLTVPERYDGLREECEASCAQCLDDPAKHTHVVESAHEALVGIGKQLYTIPSAVLCCLAGRLGRRESVVQGGALGHGDHTDARRDLYAGAGFEGRSLLNALAELVGPGARLVERAVLEQCDKAVAGEPAHETLTGHAGAFPAARHATQHLITAVEAKQIVDHVQLVEIAIDQPPHNLWADGQTPIDRRVEGLAVQQPRGFVVARFDNLKKPARKFLIEPLLALPELHALVGATGDEHSNDRFPSLYGRSNDSKRNQALGPLEAGFIEHQCGALVAHGGPQVGGGKLTQRQDLSVRPSLRRDAAVYAP